jgi:hypothetical protein
MIITLTNARFCAHQVAPGGVEDLSMTFESVTREFWSQNATTGELEQKGKTTFHLTKRATS